MVELSADLRFRYATEDDVDEIVALVESAYRGAASREGWTTEADLLDGQRTDRDDVTAIISGAPGNYILLAEQHARVVGSCHLQRRMQACAYVGMLAVRPKAQRGGIGRAMFQEAERLARAFGATHIQMTVICQRTDLIEWYERLGYSRTGETLPFPYGNLRFGIPLRDDLEFIVLSKSL